MPTRAIVFYILMVATFALRAALPASEWVKPPITGQNLQRGIFPSVTVKTEVSYLIYLPEDYAKHPDSRFPVIYWLHGIGGSQQGVPRMCENFTSAIAKGKMPSAIVVFVNGMTDSFYCDAINAARPVETVIIKELIPHIDAKFRTVARREGRMIEGFSMGGYGAGHLGFKYPELFGAVSMIDGALVDLGNIKHRHGELFQRIFDSNEENFTTAHPLTLVGKNVAQIKERTLIRQAVGKLVQPNTAMHEQLNRLHIAHDYDVFEGVGHNLAAIYERLGDKNWEFYAKAFVASPTNPKASAPSKSRPTLQTPALH